MDFKDKLILARKEVGMSRQKIQAATGYPLGTLENWEYGRTAPPKYEENTIIQRILQLKRTCILVFCPYSTIRLVINDKNETKKYNLNISADGQRLERDLFLLNQDGYKITFKYEK